jgi:hypothetical protein
VNGRPISLSCCRPNQRQPTPNDYLLLDQPLIFARLLRISRNSCGPLISLRWRSCRSSSVADGSPLINALRVAHPNIKRPSLAVKPPKWSEMKIPGPRTRCTKATSKEALTRRALKRVGGNSNSKGSSRAVQNRIVTSASRTDTAQLCDVLKERCCGHCAQICTRGKAIRYQSVICTWKITLPR